MRALLRLYSPQLRAKNWNNLILRNRKSQVNSHIQFLMFQKKTLSPANTLLAWDYDDTFTANGVSDVLNSKGHRGWQKGNLNSPSFTDHEAIYSIRNHLLMRHLLRDIIRNDSVSLSIASYSDHHRFIRQSISHSAEEESIPGINEILIKKATCHHPFYQDKEGRYIENPEDLIALMKKCTNTKQLLKLIAQEPKEEKEQNMYRLDKLGKLFHHGSSW